MQNNLQKFELAIIRPIKGQRGELKFYRTVSAPNVTDAVASVRREVEGSGLVVLQSASYHHGAVMNDVIVNRLAEAYERSIA